MRSEDRPDISQYVVDELGLGDILELKNGSLPEFFTAICFSISFPEAFLTGRSACWSATEG